MNIDYLKNFIEVVESGTISAASTKLLIAQPALSNQIKALETVYGTQLLIRKARSVSLTEAGLILYNKAKNICALLDSAQIEINANARNYRGTLWLGISASLPDSHITNVLLGFSTAYPNTTYEIFEASADNLVEWLKNGIIEIAIFRQRENVHPLLESLYTIDEPLVAIYHRESTLIKSEGSKIPLSLLRDVPLSTTKGLRHTIKNSCKEAGFSPFFKYTSSSRLMSLLWVQRDLAVTILPARAINDYESDFLCCCPFDDPAMSVSRSFHYLKSRKLSSVARLFLNFVAEDAKHW